MTMTLHERDAEPSLAAASSSSSASKKDEKPISSSSSSILPSMTKSTIYKRHQARVLKNMEKRDDPRPAVIRVLSGLPGFRVVIPPYDPSTSSTGINKPQQQQPQAPSSASLAAFDNDTTTTILSGLSTTSNFASENSSSNLRQEEQHLYYNATFQPLNVLLTAGVVGATVEALQGNRTTATPRSNNHAAASPFRAMKSKGATGGAGVVAQPQGGMSVFKFHNQHVHSSSPSAAAAKPLQLASKSQVYAGAATASVLFGTKAIVSKCLEEGEQHQQKQQEQEQTEALHEMKNNNNPLSLIVSSATAGAMVAAVNGIRSATQNSTRILRMPISQPLVSTLPRHMVGATVYFSSYEIIQSFLSNNNNINNKAGSLQKKKKSVTSVALSGAVAGALYQSILLYYQNTMVGLTAATTPITAPGSSSSLRWMVPTIMRVAPAHALLFVAYEWVQGNH